MLVEQPLPWLGSRVRDRHLMGVLSECPRGKRARFVAEGVVTGSSLKQILTDYQQLWDGGYTPLQLRRRARSGERIGMADIAETMPR
jgi:hypothetical protein